ncbi:MAG: 16S rRNA (cytosine(1402)-N(4))-methyltransferase RsmH [Planctomycetota bacterium]|jgi:16S rRNA (cytosine1402-N4)-methyltransferase
MDRQDAANSGPESAPPHVPVLVEEIRHGLELRPGAIVVDATVGAGGHALELIGDIGSEGVYVGIDRDPEILEIAKQRLAGHSNFHICHGDFRDLKELMEKIGIVAADAILLDLGVSSFQLSEARRGFSFQDDGPLDMRFDPTGNEKSAADILSRIPENELEEALRKYGDERRSRKIAAVICSRRGRGPIRTTSELAEIVAQAIGRRGKIHPATRTFQALRMLVNSELDALEAAMEQLPAVLIPDGRAAVISFHSGEDRIVKNAFRNAAKNGFLEVVTPKPLTPGDEEIAGNARARSAKLRIAKRTFTSLRSKGGGN